MSAWMPRYLRDAYEIAPRLGGGGGGSTTTVQKSDPWAEQKPYLTKAFQQAGNLYDSGQLAPGYYPGQTVAGQSPYTQQAIGLLANQATSAQSQGLANAATGQITDTLNGKYLDPQSNPYFQGYLNNAADAYARGTAAQTDAAFNSGGAYGGSAYQETKQAQNKAFADSLNDLGNQQYQQARQQQLQAAALAPQTSGIPYANIAQLANAGQSQDAYNQNLINADMSRYNYNANLPYNALANYQGLIQGNYGGTSTSSTPYYTNPLGSGLGGAVSGAAAGSMFGPWGTAIGGGIGLLGGLFGNR